MAKSKKDNKNSKPSVKVQDLAPKKNPKGGVMPTAVEKSGFKK